MKSLSHIMDATRLVKITELLMQLSSYDIEDLQSNWISLTERHPAFITISSETRMLILSIRDEQR